MNVCPSLLLLYLLPIATIKASNVPIGCRFSSGGFFPRQIRHGESMTQRLPSFATLHLAARKEGVYSCLHEREKRYQSNDFCVQLKIHI
jgi:hypothetical protein